MSAPDEQTLEAGGMAVRFKWLGDRYAHEIWLAERSRRAGEETLSWTLALASIEGTQADDWPPSPPFQSLQIERRSANQSVALLVGMAGQSHWSASVEVEAAVPRIRFDIACRVGDSQPGPLRSSYRPARPSPTDVLIAVDDSASRVERTLDDVLIAPQHQPGAARTIRWSYTIAAQAAASKR